MTTKPILLWPKPRSDIASHLDREADDFLVVDTDYPHELRSSTSSDVSSRFLIHTPAMESTIETLVITLSQLTAATTSSGSKIVRNCCKP